MSSNREIKTNFSADTDDLERGAARAEQAIDGAERSTSRLSGAASGLTRVAGTLAGAAALGGATRAAWDFASAAAADEESATRLRETLRNVTSATDEQIRSAEEWIDATQSQTGILDDGLRGALNQAVLATDDLSTAQDLATVAMDISAGTGRDLGAVIEAIAAQQRGETDALQSMGIATNDATGELLALDEVLAGASEAFGGQMAASTETASGQLRIAQANFAEIKEELGEKLLPVLVEFAQFLVQDVVPAVEDVSAWIEEHWPEIAETAEDVFGRVSAAVQVAWDMVGPIILGIWDAVSALVELVANVIQGDWGDAWDAAYRLVVGAWQAISGVLGLVVDAVGAAVGLIWDAFTGLVSSVGDLFAEMGRNILDGIMEGLTGGVGLALDIATGLADAILDVINDMIASINDAIPNSIDIPGPFGSINLPDNPIPTIPSLASEGFLNTDSLIMAHAGEVVADIDRVESWLGVGGGGSGSTIVLQGDSFSADAVEAALHELERRHGAIRITVERSRLVAA